MEMELITFLWRWLHVISGVMWIGILWYFNFVQIPNMGKIPDEQKPAIGKVIAPAALFWFRHGAMATIFTGLMLAWSNGYIGQALSLGLNGGGAQITAIGFKAASARTAMLFSRTNTMLSIPMLFAMVSAQNYAY